MQLLHVAYISDELILFTAFCLMPERLFASFGVRPSVRSHFPKRQIDLSSVGVHKQFFFAASRVKLPIFIQNLIYCFKGV